MTQKKEVTVKRQRLGQSEHPDLFFFSSEYMHVYICLCGYAHVRLESDVIHLPLCSHLSLPPH